jgi:imidazolonepropionase-like amidohydrolase
MKMKMLIYFLCCIPILSFSQVPTPAEPQLKTIVLKGATIHVGNGNVIENGVVKFESGKIVFIGKENELKISGSEHLIDVKGKHIYPGFIAPNTVLGLVEIEAARPTRDFSEVGDFNPNVRSLIAYNTDSRIIPTIRSNGILLAQITPQSGSISGSSSIVQLDAWNWEDAAYKTDIGIHLHWPILNIKKGWWAEPEGNEANKKYSEAVKKIHDFFSEAKAYQQQPSEEKNLKFEAMKDVFSGSKKVFVHVSTAKEIMEVAAFKKTFGIDLVIVGGEESYQVADVLKENKIPVILNELHSLPGKPEDDIDLPYRLPYLLKQAGVEFCLSMNGSWQQRNLPFIAGTAAGYGLTKEEALAAITSSTAKILGLDKITGTIETGKDANIIVSEGDVLDMRSSIIIYAFIQGRQIVLDNHQTQLYRKFTNKYGNQ